MKKYIPLLLGVVGVWILVLTIILNFSSVIPVRFGYIHPHFPLANFDGIHYLEIAKNGYTNNMRFMPLYPLLISIAATIIPFMPLYWIGFLISLFFFISSFIYLNELFRLDYSNKQVQRAILFLFFFTDELFFRERLLRKSLPISHCIFALLCPQANVDTCRFAGIFFIPYPYCWVSYYCPSPHGIRFATQEKKHKTIACSLCRAIRYSSLFYL